MKKELLIIVSILIILTISVHYKEFLSHPLDHVIALGNSGAYGFGSSHPLVFTFIIYILLLIPRLIIKLLNKKSK
jgi:membrane-associated phospholipid phosphatase